MGKKVRKKAESLGLKKQRHTILYACPRRTRTTYSRAVPDVADAIRDYVTLLDPTMLQDRSGGIHNDYYYLAASFNLYVEVIGTAAFNLANRIQQINIYTENEEYIRGVANAVNSLWDDAGGLLAHMVWKTVEKKFKVSQEACIAEWKKWL